MKSGILYLVLLISQLAMSCAALAQEDLVDEIQNVKREVLKLNRDLFVLEEDLLFPASSQFNVYVSIDKGHYFTVESVEVRLDNEPVSSHLYTQQELAALERGAIQKVHQGNLNSGDYNLVAVVNGLGPNEQPYRQAIEFEFAKAKQPVHLELRVTDQASKQQPKLSVRQWQN